MPSAAQVIRDWADPEAIAMKTVRAAVRPDFVDDSRNVQCLGLLAYARSVLKACSTRRYRRKAGEG